MPSNCNENTDDFFSDDFDVVYDTSFENQNYQFDEFMQALYRDEGIHSSYGY